MCVARSVVCSELSFCPTNFLNGVLYNLSPVEADSSESPKQGLQTQTGTFVVGTFHKFLTFWQLQNTDEFVVLGEEGALISPRGGVFWLGLV